MRGREGKKPQVVSGKREEKEKKRKSERWREEGSPEERKKVRGREPTPNRIIGGESEGASEGARSMGGASLEKPTFQTLFLLSIPTSSSGMVVKHNRLGEKRL